MQKTRPLIALLALVLSSAPAGAATEPVVFADGGQFAVADWLLIGERHALNYLVAAARGATAEDGPGAEAFLARLPCDVERHPRYIVVRCVGRVRAHPIDPAQFQVDPLLRSASLSFEARGFTHEVRWRGQRDAAPPAVRAGAGAAYAEGAAGAVMPAAARGRVFGRNLRYTRYDWAIIDQGAIAVAEVFLEDGSDGTITRTLRIPR